MTDPNNPLSKTLITHPKSGQLPTSPLKKNRPSDDSAVAEDEMNHTKVRIKTEFNIRFDNLEKDIAHIDGRMKHIQNFCTNLDLQIKNLQTLVKADNNPGKKGQYYQIMNSCMELNATYEQLYIRCMELKQRYRKEQDDLHSKISRFVELEMPKANIENHDQALTPASLAMMMQELTRSITTNDKKAEVIKTSLQELEEDPDYKL